MDPTADGSSTFNIKTMLNDNWDKIDAAVASVEEATIAPGAATDTVIGTRTGDPTLASPASTGTLTQLFGWIMGRIKAITGKTNWYDAPDITLASLNAHKSRHATGGADAIAPSDIGAAAATDLSTTNSAVTALSTTVGTKANQSDLTTTNATVAGHLAETATSTQIGHVEIVETPASGAPVVPTRCASFQETKITGTTAQTVLTYTPQANHNFELNLSIRVVTATTTVTILVTYTDAGGAESYYVLNAQSCAVGNYACVPFAFNAVNTGAITVSVTTGIVNQVYVSGALKAV
jgi:hypothetical protein